MTYYTWRVYCPCCQAEGGGVGQERSECIKSAERWTPKQSGFTSHDFQIEVHEHE